MSNLEGELVVVLDEITHSVDVIFDHDEPIAVQKVLSGDLRRQVHPVFDQVNVVDKHVLIQMSCSGHLS